jgi:hypothetical protein
MRLREHPKIQWPPRWSEQGESSFRGEDGILKEVDFYRTEHASSKQRSGRKNLFCRTILLQHGFASRLHEKLKPILGRPIIEVGELDF